MSDLTTTQLKARNIGIVLDVVDESLTRAAELRQKAQAEAAERRAEEARRAERSERREVNIRRQEERDARETIERLRERADLLAADIAARQAARDEAL